MVGDRAREADISPEPLSGAFRRSLHIRHVDYGSDGAVEQELAALLNPYYDMQRLGLFFTASPRHADVLLVTGPVTRPMVEPLRRTYEAMPEPRVVIAAGTDACSGGIWNGPEVLGGVDQVLPVDVYIPGDPPSPIALLHALLLASGRAPGGRRTSAGRVTTVNALAVLMIIGCGGLAARRGAGDPRRSAPGRLGSGRRVRRARGRGDRSPCSASGSSGSRLTGLRSGVAGSTSTTSPACS